MTGASTPSGESGESGELAAALGERLGGEVVDLQRLSGGASRETWAVDLVSRDGDDLPAGAATGDGDDPGGTAPRHLILQRARPGSVPGPAMTTQARLLAAAADHDVPVAGLVATGDGHDDAGAGAQGGLDRPWMCLERLEGRVLPRDVLGDADLAATREVLAGQCGRALAGIHAIDPQAGVGGDLDATDQLEAFRAVLDTLDQPRPALEIGFRRLAASRPPATGHTVVHGDFRTGNLLVDRTGLVAVLDWELAHLGDPAEDLGWLCLRSWRFGSPARVGGFGAAEDLLAAYRDASRRDVSVETLRWWEAVGALKWAVMCLVQAEAHRSGASRSVELAAIGRRAAESEWDLLGLLGITRPSRHLDPSAAAAGMPSPLGRPSATELLEAAREFVDSGVRAATTGRTRFHAKVTANVLDLVSREIALGPQVADRHGERLARLGVRDDAELAAAIRAGDVDAEDDDVATLLAASVADQLAVANPRHLEPDR